MRKIIVLEHISLDGVIQSPGGQEEDVSGDFNLGGWISPYSDEILGTLLRQKMNMAFDLLLGRKTFDNWELYWPMHNDIWSQVNSATKYIASNTRTSTEWQPSEFLNDDIVDKISKIKQMDGPELHVWGSANLVQTLLKNDLIDAFWLMIYPVVLGSGKHLFAGGTIPMAFKVTESETTSKGVIIVKYEREAPKE